MTVGLGGGPVNQIAAHHGAAISEQALVDVANLDVADASPSCGSRDLDVAANTFGVI
ncbi:MULTISPECIES: hypothetical protein [unclassified Pseudonocardia]|uniref:hypothetical protein n=1 Tax=unclassified Pseudonocardia TaxID=2619320 RepID=UPI001ACF9FA8|nr:MULTISPECIES: hypothetical protein [unclassified Pseudonocardia]MBN9098075.1 hypothetical protein [Pseudonocardia sp.]